MSSTTAPASPPSSQDPLGLVAQTLERLRFVAIQLVGHDGQGTQVEVTERKRFGA